MKNLIANKYQRITGKDGREYLIKPKEVFECFECGKDIPITRDKNDKIILEECPKCSNPVNNSICKHKVNKKNCKTCGRYCDTCYYGHNGKKCQSKKCICSLCNELCLILTRN